MILKYRKSAFSSNVFEELFQPWRLTEIEKE